MCFLNDCVRFILLRISQWQKCVCAWSRETETGRKMVQGRKTDCRGGVTAGNDKCLFSIFACKRWLANASVALMYVFMCANCDNLAAWDANRRRSEGRSNLRWTSRSLKCARCIWSKVKLFLYHSQTARRSVWVRTAVVNHLDSAPLQLQSEQRQRGARTSQQRNVQFFFTANTRSCQFIDLHAGVRREPERSGSGAG